MSFTARVTCVGVKPIVTGIHLQADLYSSDVLSPTVEDAAADDDDDDVDDDG